MDSEHHHELERNDLADWIENGLAYLRPRWKYIFGAIGAALVLFVGWQWYNASAASARAAAWNEYFGSNYKDVTDRYPNSDAARYARLRLGDAAFQDGMTALLGSRDEAIQSFDKAVQQYDAIVADSAAPPDVRRKAMLNRAIAFECRGAPERATEAYKSVSAQYADTTEALIAEERVKRLARKSSVEFYQQFVNYKPSATDLTPPAPPGAGAFPAMPDLLENLKKASENNKAKTPPPPPVPPSDMKLPPSTGATQPQKVTPADLKPAAKDPKTPAKDAKPTDAKGTDAKAPAKDSKPTTAVPKK